MEHAVTFRVSGRAIRFDSSTDTRTPLPFQDAVNKAVEG